MKTVTRTYKTYNLHELTIEAQAKAHDHWAENNEYAWDVENRATLQAFERVFNIRAERWSYDSCNYTYYFTSHNGEEEDNLKGTRLLKYIVNNYWDELYSPKTYWSRNHKKRHKSRIFVNNDYVLTGYCLDYEILKPIYDFLKAPDNATLYELIDRCLNSFFKACMNDMKDYYSEEAFAESCEANNYEFLYDGTVFN